jgi:hypothetical protein
MTGNNTSTTLKPDDVLPEHIEGCKLTHAQKQKWDEIMTGMNWSCPGFSYLFVKLLSKRGDGECYALPTKDVPIAATDGDNIMINPDAFLGKDTGGPRLDGGFGLPECWLIMAHEVMHNVYNDPAMMHRCRKSGVVPMNDGSTLPYNHDMMNRAMDYRINALLVESKIGRMPKNPDGTIFGCYDPKIATANDSVLDIYKKLYEDEQGGGGKGKGPGKPQPGKGPGGFDQVLAPGTSMGTNPDDAANQRSQDQWDVEMAAARTIEQARSQGDMAAALQQMFKNILEPTVPWTDHIATIIRRRWGVGSYDWRRPDRRWIGHDVYIPAPGGMQAGWLVIWRDMSGSMSDNEVMQCTAELHGIVEECHPKRITVIDCDSRIHKVHELEGPEGLIDLHCRTAHGGTSIHPVMQWIGDQMEKPNLFIGFTDGEFDFPIEPSFQTIWASVRDHEYPYGDVVRVRTKEHP